MKHVINLNFLSKIAGLTLAFIVLVSAVSAGYLVDKNDVALARGQIYDIADSNNIQMSNYMGNRELLMGQGKNEFKENESQILRLKMYNFEKTDKLHNLTLRLSL